MQKSKIFVCFYLIIFIFTFYFKNGMSQSTYGYWLDIGPCKIISIYNIVILSYQGSDYFAGASWANGRWYAVTYTSHNFLYCDTTTGTNTVIGNIGAVYGSPVALCWDPVTSTMFMLTAGPNNLYTVNMNTGVATLVALITGTMTNLFAGAVSNSGRLFGIELPPPYPFLGRINKTTGVWTAIGPLGTMIINGPQAIAFNRNPPGNLWWASYIQQPGIGGLRIIDTVTGYSYPVGYFQNNAHITGFVIPYGLVGIKRESNEFPKEFRLEQNYPNPFNSSSKIKFQVARYGLVKLMVYDVLGREVETLVNEQLKPGTYTVEFDGTNLSSGVYFYRMETGEYVESKRMVLSK